LKKKDETLYDRFEMTCYTVPACFRYYEKDNANLPRGFKYRLYYALVFCVFMQILIISFVLWNLANIKTSGDKDNEK